MPDQVFGVNAFASFTYVWNDGPANTAVFIFEDDAGKRLLLRTTLHIASEMRTLLNEAFMQMEEAGVGLPIGLLTLAAQSGSKAH